MWGINFNFIVMKIIKQLFKTIEQKSKLDLITELLIVGNSTEDAFKLFDKVRANFTLEMNQRKWQMEKDMKLISKISQQRDYSHCDKPLSEIEIDYETVKYN